MDPFAGAAIAGGAGVIGAYMTNQANSAQAQRQMDFQERMSGTAHQREVQDLRAAGLNPMLSALGNGASTPSGAAAQMQDPSEGVQKGINTAIAIKQQNKEFQQKDAQIRNTNQDTQNKIVNTGLASAQAMSTAKDVEQKIMQNKMLQQTLPSLIKKAKAEGDFSEVNQIMGIINSGASSASQLMNPLKGLLPKGKK